MMDFIEKLRNRLLEPMPGLEYQSQMLPGNRLRKYPSKETLAAARRAGVCMLFYQKQEQWHTVLIQRTTYKGVHSGQMAFPGGTAEEQDVDLTATALRETEEEVGINAKKITVLGKLSPVYIPPSNMYVEPVIGFLESVPLFRKEEREVAEIVEVPIDLLLEPGIKKKKPIKMGKDFEPITPYFDVNGYTVWGATAAMISEFIQVSKEMDL